MWNTLKNSVRDIATKISIGQVLTDYAEYQTSKSSKRALLSYLVHPLLPPRAMREQVMFSNKGIAQELPRVLNELGYIVDIVDYRNRNWVPKEQYDLFIGHGGYNFARLSRFAAFSIYFATGLYWKEQNTRAAKRLYEFTLRRGNVLYPERVAPASEEDSLSCANAVVCLGNHSAAKSFQQYQKVEYINNAVFPLDDILKASLLNKNFDTARRHFLFFSGSGNVHKGLDLLLDTFSSMPQFHLHVCQQLTPEFTRIFARELALPNIHLEGFVQMRSQRFCRLVNQCNWVILPTCSEGQPGSVLECMAFGLNPILPESANIDADDLAITIPSLDIEGVTDAVNRTDAWTSNMCYENAKFVEGQILKKYTPTEFRHCLQSSLTRIIEAD